MNNLNKEISQKIKNITSYEYSSFESKPPIENSMVMENSDTEFIDKVISYYEIQKDNPNAWVSWEAAKNILRRYD